MKSIKSFVVGVIFGTLLVSGIGYAADQLHIEVSVPDITYWLDGKKLDIEVQDDLPNTIQYRNVNYVPVRNFAEALQKEVEWNGTRHEVHLHTVKQIEFEEIEQLNPTLEEWVENSKVVESAQVQTIEGQPYLLITLGEKNTGGYTVEVKEIKQYVDGVTVVVQKTEPKKGALVTEVIDYPYTLVQLKDDYFGSIQFIDTEGTIIPSLVGIEFIPSLMENADHILLFEPEITEDTIVIDGIVQAFEGFVVYSISDANGDIITHESIQASGANPDWGYFSKEILIEEVPQNSSIIIQAVNDNEEIEKDFVQLNVRDMLMAK